MAELIKKGLLLHVAIAIMCLLSTFLGSLTFGVIIGALLYAGYVIMMYGEGCSVGEHHCTVSSTLERLEKEGKQGDDKLRKNAFAPAKAYKACAVLAGIPLILAIINLIVADPNSASEKLFGTIVRACFLPEAFITRWCSERIETNITGAIAAGAAALRSIDYGTINFQGLIREVSAIDMYGFASDLSPLRLMRYLYIPACVLPGIAQMVGYLQGPRLRAKTVKEMMEGSRKKKRRMLGKRRTRQVKQAKPEV